jgi:predicted ATPase
VPCGLYFLDEPETPLSPTRVLALLAILRERVEIPLFEDGAIAPIAYRDVEHVRITRVFLDDPESFLRRL